MNYDRMKITVFNIETEKYEDVELFCVNEAGTVGISCGNQNVYLTQDQFKALAYLFGRCSYTRDTVNEMQAAIDCCEFPYSVFSSHNGKVWKLVEEEKD